MLFNSIVRVWQRDHSKRRLPVFSFYERSIFVVARSNLFLSAGEFRDRLGPFTDGMFGQFTGQHQTDSRLDLTAAQRRLFVVRGQLARLGRNTFKDIVNERVHDRHTLFGNTRVGVDWRFGWEVVGNVTVRGREAEGNKNK